MNADAFSLKRKISSLWMAVGLFTKLILIINLVVYVLQMARKTDQQLYSVCLAPIIDAKQVYRVVTSEFTHENPAYFALNIVGLLVFGNKVERTYGTAFCAILHFVILTTSTMLSLGFYLLMAYYVPFTYRGGSDNFFHCASGYSNIVFGLAMISCLQGDPQQSFLGLCSLEKKYTPWLFMLVVYFTIPNSYFLGHFCGLIAGLFIKYWGLYVLLPRFDWVDEFDDEWCEKLKLWGYQQSSLHIENDFDAHIWAGLYRTLRKAFFILRSSLFGYEYVPEPSEPVVCPGSIELGDVSIEVIRY